MNCSFDIVSQNSHNQAIEQLLKEHADVNFQNKEGVTALMTASQNGHTKVIGQLLKEDADVDIQNKMIFRTKMDGLP